MKNLNTLLSISASLGSPVPSGADIGQFFRRKVTNLYRDQTFRKFLDKQTGFLPKSVPAFQRWQYYLAGETKPHLCPTCNIFMENFQFKFCSPRCGTTHRHKTEPSFGPGIDLVKKEKDWKQRVKTELVGYKIAKFGHPRSTFKHSCGTTFEANNHALFRARPLGCPCLRKKAPKHTLDTLKARYKKLDSVWTPVAYIEGSKEATFKNRKCKHTVEMPWSRDFDMRCSVCFPNKFASGGMTPKEYRAWLKSEFPEYKALDDYEGISTRIRYRHNCGGVTKTTPNWFKRPSFRCSHCGPRTSGSLHAYTLGGQEFLVRGKEAVAIKWILENTRYKAADMQVDSGGSVPLIYYRELSGDQKRKYYPDLFIQKKNLIVEVKDLNTLGICKTFFYVEGEQLWATNCAKARACRAKGYTFRMLVFNAKNERIALPKNWTEYSHKKILKWFKDRGITNQKGIK